MLRAIGGCLLAVGVTTLVLTNIPIRRGEGWARVAVVVLVGLAEGNNSYRMFAFDSPWYAPLSFVVLAMAGSLLARPRRAADAEAGADLRAAPAAAV